MKKLTQKTALITGGSSGIGLATARLFYENGANVIIVGRDPQKLAHAVQLIGEEIQTISADVSTMSGIDHLLTQVNRPIDILFANAGASHNHEWLETTEADFDAAVNTNIKSVFFLITRSFKQLSDGATIILTSSIAHRKGRPGDPLYAATKAAVRSFGRTFAMQEEVLNRKIRVNVISPGAVATPLTQQDQPEMQQAIDGYITSSVPMARWGTAEEIAKSVLFLASDDSSYITGADLTVDGGWSQL